MKTFNATKEVQKFVIVLNCFCFKPVTTRQFINESLQFQSRITLITILRISATSNNLHDIISKNNEVISITLILTKLLATRTGWEFRI